jgi:hypothetical protein
VGLAVIVGLGTLAITTPCALASSRYAEPKNVQIGMAHSWSLTIGSSTSAAQRAFGVVAREPRHAVILVKCFWAFVLPFVLATAGFRVVGQRGMRGRLWCGLLCAAMAVSPLAIPAERRLLRFLAAMTVASQGAKLYDHRLDCLRGRKTRLREYLGFLVNPFVIVRRCLTLEPRPPRTKNLQGLVGGICGLAAGVVLCRHVFVIDWSNIPFLVEHSAKMFAFYVALFSGLSAGSAGWRLLGGSARDYMNRPYLARTPGGFWRRYNRISQQFFAEDIFKSLDHRLGGPDRILTVFVVSAVVHEYVFGIATGRIQGYQTAFFLLQGVAVTATARVRPRGRLAILWATATALFMLVSSTLFFASMQGVVPFYARPFGGWSWEGWTRHESP